MQLKEQLKEQLQEEVICIIPISDWFKGAPLNL